MLLPEGISPSFLRLNVEDRSSTRRGNDREKLLEESLEETISVDSDRSTFQKGRILIFR